MVGARVRRQQVADARRRGRSSRRACAVLSVARSTLGYESRQSWSPIFGQVVKVESRSDRRNLECHERDGATRLS